MLSITLQSRVFYFIQTSQIQRSRYRPFSCVAVKFCFMTLGTITNCSDLSGKTFQNLCSVSLQCLTVIGKRIASLLSVAKQKNGERAFKLSCLYLQVQSIDRFCLVLIVDICIAQRGKKTANGSYSCTSEHALLRDESRQLLLEVSFSTKRSRIVAMAAAQQHLDGNTSCCVAGRQYLVVAAVPTSRCCMICSVQQPKSIVAGKRNSTRYSTEVSPDALLCVTIGLASLADSSVQRNCSC